MRLRSFIAILIYAGMLVGAIGGCFLYDEDNYNCKHSSIAMHDLLAKHGIQSHYACAILTPDVGHVWVVIELGPFSIPFETVSMGVPKPCLILSYVNPDYIFSTAEEMFAFEKTYFNM